MRWLEPGTLRKSFLLGCPWSPSPTLRVFGPRGVSLKLRAKPVLPLLRSCCGSPVPPGENPAPRMATGPVWSCLLRGSGQQAALHPSPSDPPSPTAGPTRSHFSSRLLRAGPRVSTCQPTSSGPGLAPSVHEARLGALAHGGTARLTPHWPPWRGQGPRVCARRPLRPLCVPQPEGNILRDRFKSFQRRNMIEPRERAK